MPQISVIVPVFKVEPYLQRCVDSILNQTFTDFELILVDDGSPDNCGAICDDYAAKDERAHVIHQQNGGLSAARNAGIDWVFANSDSQWLSFIDSDDWVHTCYLEHLYRAVVETGSSVSTCLYTRVLPGGEVVDHPSTYKDREVLSYDSYFSKTGIGFTPYVAWAKLYKIDCFKSIRYPIGKLNEDLFTTHRLLFSCETITRVNAALYYYYQSEESIMRRKWTPARLDEVDASMNLLRFMHENKIVGAEKTAYQRMLWVLRNHITMIRAEKCNSYPAIEKALMRKGRNLLLFWDNKTVPLSNKSLDFDFFFPKLSWLYWTGVGILRKIKKTIRK